MDYLKAGDLRYRNLRNLLILIQYMLKILDNYDNVHKNYILKFLYLIF